MCVDCLPHVLCCLTEHYFLYLIFPPLSSSLLMGSVWFTPCCLPSRGPPPPSPFSPCSRDGSSHTEQFPISFVHAGSSDPPVQLRLTVLPAGPPQLSPLPVRATGSAVAGGTLESAILFSPSFPSPVLFLFSISSPLSVSVLPFLPFILCFLVWRR